MGYWASPQHDLGKLYLNTQSPVRYGDLFCLQNFGVALSSGNQQRQNQARGTFTIQFESASGHRSSYEFLDYDENTFKKNSIEYRLVSLKNQFNYEITKAHIYYKRTSNWLSWWLYDDQWAFSLVEITHGDQQKKWRFCQPTVWIPSGQTIEFYRCAY